MPQQEEGATHRSSGDPRYVIGIAGRRANALDRSNYDGAIPLGKHDRAILYKSFDHRRAFLGDIALKLADACGRGIPRDVGLVLDQHWQVGQRSKLLALRTRLIDRTRRAQHALLIQGSGNDRVEILMSVVMLQQPRNVELGLHFALPDARDGLARTEA